VSDGPPGPQSSGNRRRLLVATHSAHKLRELRELLDLPGTDLVSLDDLDIADDPDETGATFRTNAAIKARAGLAASGTPTLADDSGLEVDALGRGPGVRTRRYAGAGATDADNNAKLLSELSGLPPRARGARYVCVLALAEPGRPLVFRQGTVRGRIATAPRGDGGFGYDPIFEPTPEPPGGRTFAEWSAEEKNRVSHRGRAARRMARVLRERGF
jgi:XTP/dITP diphosphohydrolase